jgi:hypothetical protein
MAGMLIVNKRRMIIANLTPLIIVMATVLLLSGCGHARKAVAVELTIHIDIAALAEVSDQVLVDQYRFALQEYERANWFESLFMQVPQPPPNIVVPSPRTMLALCCDGVVLDAKPLTAIGRYDVVLTGTGPDPVLCFMAGSDSVRLAIRVVPQSAYTIQVGPGVTIVKLAGTEDR